MSCTETAENPTLRALRGAAWAVLIVLPLFSLSCGGKEKPSEDQSDSAGLGSDEDYVFIAVPVPDEILLEAEDARIEAPMVIVDDDVIPDESEIHHASKARYVNLPDKVGKGEDVGGKIIFRLEVEKPGKYLLWARVNWLDNCGNSFNVAMDNGPAIMLGDYGTTECWQWINIRGKDGRFRLSKGKHTLEFRNREDGASLDQILLTTNLDEQAPPQGILAP